MANVELSEEMSKKIIDWVGVYAAASGETIPEDFSRMAIDMLLSKYCDVRRFPSEMSTDDVVDDVETYFSDNASRLAYEVPKLYGRIGSEGVKSMSENGVSQTYESGDPLYDCFRNVSPFVRLY